MARPGTERGWTDCAKRHDWPLRKRRENLPDGQGPPVGDWPTEEELAAREERAS